MQLQKIGLAWYTPIVFFFLLHIFLFLSLDLSDLPGAAGTLHLFQAMLGSQKSDEINTFYVWLHNKGFSFVSAAWFFSFLGVCMGYLGILLGAWAHDSWKGMRNLAWMLLFWPPLHLYGFLIGVDSFVFGMSFLGAGLIWFSFRQPQWGWVLFFPAYLLLKTAISLKLMVAPVVLCTLLAPFCVRTWHKMHWVLVLGMMYTVQQALPPLSADGTLQGGLRIPEVDWLPIAMGWDRLRGLPAMGMPEGKWDQLIFITVLGAIIVPLRYGIRLLGVIIAALILIVSAFVLEDRLNTRLLTPASFAVLAMLPVLFRRWYALLPFVVAGMGMELWAFVDQFQTSRHNWAKTHLMPIPAAPYLWKSQYIENQTIFKGLSLYGAANARKIIELSTASIVFSMRLRDGRENSLFVYASMKGKETQTLDIQTCCGRMAESMCAEKIVSSIVENGGLIVIPSVVESWERVYTNEQRWNKALLSTLTKYNEVRMDDSWVWISGSAQQETQSWPCSK